VGAVLVSTVLAGATYVIARSYLVSQRERSAVRQAYVDARVVRDGLLTSGAEVTRVLGQVAPPSQNQVLVQRQGQWFSSSLDLGPDDLPTELLGDGRTPREPRVMWFRVQEQAALGVVVPLPTVEAVFYEVAVLDELESTLETLRLVLAGVAVATALAAAALGRWAAARAVQPLDEVAGAAARIAGGRLETRLAPTRDPDLSAIVGSFNGMVDALAARIDRETRFTADVAHELRSPLTTLVAGLGLLQARRDELPERSQRAVDLMGAELARFHRVLEDLLELSRLDAGVDYDEREVVDLRELVEHALRDGGHRAVLPVPGADGPAPVRVAKRQVERALINLFENADRHGDGLADVSLDVRNGSVLVLVDDDGPGIEPAERERIFERFARGRTSRGSTPGTGLGLSLVAETMRVHGGAVWCADRPGGGGRFVLRFPLDSAPVGGPR
jgi:signal transduction histidine kinase